MNHYKFRECFLYAAIVLILSTNLYSQTSEVANYEVYSRESYLTSIGYYTMSFTLPESYGNTVVKQHGMSYNHFYDITNLGSIPIEYEHQVSFYLTGAFRLAAATGTASLNQSMPDLDSNNPKFYSASMDIFSLYVVPEYTYVIKRGYAVTVKLGINLINVGGSVAFPEHGNIRNHLFGTINLLPLGFTPAVFFDFGRSGLGILAHINPSNFLSYNFAPRILYGDERGVTGLNSFIRRYDFEIIFTF